MCDPIPGVEAVPFPFLNFSLLGHITLRSVQRIDTTSVVRDVARVSHVQHIMMGAMRLSVSHVGAHTCILKTELQMSPRGDSSFFDDTFFYYYIYSSFLYFY